jgi:branched-chain amino acid transport system permease protein
MRFIFKTDYDQDIRLFKHGGQKFWYAMLAVVLLAAPWVLSEYHLAQLSLVCIYGIVGLGLMLLTGYTGLVSIGHAAFLGVGAYAEAILAARGWPLPLSIAFAMLLSAAVGVVVGLPALRVRGIYLAIATLAFGFIVEEIITRWESLTGGNSGLSVPSADLFGWRLDSTAKFYSLTLACAALATLAVLNLLRSPTGRAFIAVRDSEISAQSMGIHLARYKTVSFALSAALTGLAGALYAHKLRFLSPDQFTVIQSIELLMMIFIGGIGSVHGAFLGALFLIALPQAIAALTPLMPAAIASAAGLQPTVFGLMLIGFILFEPMGMYGWWFKARTWLQLFPFYRRGMFKRQKAFQRSERLR